MGIINWARTHSPWIIHFNAGACNACDIEVLAGLTPRFDLERFGVILKGSPRHADVIVVTGAVTRQVKDRLVRIWEQTPEPRFVVAVGECAITGNIFRNCYNVYGGVDKVIPVAAYIPGCPVKPEAVLHGVTALLGKLRGG